MSREGPTDEVSAAPALTAAGRCARPDGEFARPSKRICRVNDQRLCLHFQVAHFGDCRPGERSQSLTWAAVSACRARRRSNSRDKLPGGSLSAASLNRLASAANRSSKVDVCLTRRRTLTMANPNLKRLPAIFKSPAVMASVRCLTQIKMAQPFSDRPTPSIRWDQENARLCTASRKGAPPSNRRDCRRNQKSATKSYSDRPPPFFVPMLVIAGHDPWASATESSCTPACRTGAQRCFTPTRYWSAYRRAT